MQPTEIPGYYKTQEGTIINNDDGALQAYKIQRVKNNRINTIEDDLKNLKNDMQEIKKLLRGLVK